MTAGRGEALKAACEAAAPWLARYRFPPEVYEAYAADFTLLLHDARACAACQGLDTCGALNRGYPVRIDPRGLELYGEPVFAVAPCRWQIRRQAEQRIQEQVRSARLRAADLEQTFDTFQPLPGVEEAYRAAREYARTFQPGRTSTGLMFLGPVGVGKSHLANAVLNELRTRGLTGLLKADVAELIAEMQTALAEGRSVGPLVEQARQATLLVLDDLGQEHKSEWVRQTVGTLLNARYLDRRPVIITTNLDFEAVMELFRERIMSRLLATCRIYVLEGDDFRMLQHQRLARTPIGG